MDEQQEASLGAPNNSPSTPTASRFHRMASSQSPTVQLTLPHNFEAIGDEFQARGIDPWQEFMRYTRRTGYYAMPNTVFGGFLGTAVPPVSPSPIGPGFEGTFLADYEDDDDEDDEEDEGDEGFSSRFTILLARAVRLRRDADHALNSFPSFSDHDDGDDEDGDSVVVGAAREVEGSDEAARRLRCVEPSWFLYARSQQATSASSDDEDGESACPICRVDWQDGEQLVSTACGHTFHQACLALWLARSDTCPICRLVDPEN